MDKSDSSSLLRQSQYADKRQWNQFLSVFLLAVGVGFTVAGVIFFFAYNWDELPKFAKLGLVEGLLAATVLLAVFTRWSLFVKQILLTGATFLTGTLFAVFGQIYQTGADAYDLFLGWTIFTLLWAIAIRFAPLWLTFIGLLCTTIGLYAVQIVPDNLLQFTLFTNSIAWICGVATGVSEWMKVKGTLKKRNYWFVGLLSAVTVVYMSFMMILAICDEKALTAIPLIGTVVLFSAGLWYGWKQRSLFNLAAIPFGVLMMLLSLFICHSHLTRVNIFFFAGLIVIIGTTLLIYFILHLKKKWYGTEE